MSVSCRRVIALIVLLKAFLNGTSSGGYGMRGIYTLHLSAGSRGWFRHLRDASLCKAKKLTTYCQVRTMVTG